MHPALTADEARLLELRHAATWGWPSSTSRLYRATTRAGSPDADNVVPIRPAPWTCEACHNLNDPTRSDCTLCGRPRQARRGVL